MVNQLTALATFVMQPVPMTYIDIRMRDLEDRLTAHLLSTEHYVDTVLAGFEDRLENLEKHCCSRDQSYHRLPFEPSSLPAGVHWGADWDSDGTDSSRDTFDWVEVEEVTHRVSILW